VLNNASSPALIIISAMITPALLILGTGSLVATALQRLVRVVDRTRAILQMSDEEARKLGWTQDMSKRWLERYDTRSLIVGRAITTFFLAVGILVLACLSIAVDRYFADRLTWLPVSLTIIGMFLILAGVYFMVQESWLANLQIREEMGVTAGRNRKSE
jgi:Protein of unknown function (DUF2721)